MTNNQLFIEAALAEVGAPYVWGGKGTNLFDPVKGVVGSPYWSDDNPQQQLKVFDCSGLITWAFMRSTGKDKRGSWSAQLMADGLPRLLEVDVLQKPHLRYYGSHPGHVTHVAAAVCMVDGRWLVIEAADGDQTTRTPLDAKERGAKVRCGIERRQDLLCCTVLPIIEVP